MKQTIEIDIPENYIRDGIKTNFQEQGDGIALAVVQFKKKQTKDFSFYIDEYLRADNCTTNDMLCNWMTSFVIDELKNNLKQNKLQFVPWEVKIGLVKFICRDKNISLKEYLYPKVTDVNYQVCDEIGSLLSDDFKRSIV